MFKHALRAALSAALTLSLALLTLGAPAAQASTLNDGYARQVINLMNAKRAAAGVAPLRWNQAIANVSQDWANHLDGATRDPAFSFATIHRPDAGGNEIPAGASWYREIIGFNATPANIVDWWMGSPSHHDAMLSASATDAGIGYVAPTSGPYAGLHLVVSNLARYNTAPPPPVPVAPKPPAPAYAFTDIGGSAFLGDITWLKQRGLTTGYPDGSFHPYTPITRDGMAAFLYRLAGSPAYTPPAVSPFRDVATSNLYYKQIAWLRFRQLSTGYPDGTFRPYDPVNRDAMAAFMYGYAASACHIQAATAFAAPSVRPFADAPVGSAFFRQVSWMKAAAISTGYPDGSYRGTAPVTREAMAAFLHRLNNYVTTRGGCR